MSMWKYILLPTLPLWLVSGRAAVDFAREVKPVIERHCLACHDHEHQKAGLILTTRKWALTPSDHGRVVVRPGQGAGSELIRRLLNHDDEKRMPKDKPALSTEEIDLLRQWIDEGMSWTEDLGGGVQHWAYKKPVKPPIPEDSAGTGFSIRNPIDAFVLRKLKQHKLQPSPRAPKATLLRRLSLDLTGLPPRVQDVLAFEADASPRAYEHAVDRLLASPRFGEHWARQWLDLARYADSNGFQADQLRDSWAFRDWVIKALNADMPFDQFSVEQLAGDLLPDASVDQKIATGFHRTVTCNVEAGVHVEENRTNQVFDRVNTTGIVWLGTSLECAQCHNHKYDPISQKEYYRIFAFFNQTPVEVKGKGGVSYDFYGPKMDLELPGKQREERDALLARKAALAEEAEVRAKYAGTRRAEWEAELVKSATAMPAWLTLKSTRLQSTGSEEFEHLDDGSILVVGTVPSTTIYTVKAEAPFSGITAIRLDALTHDSLPGTGPGRGDPVKANFILSEIELYASKTPGEQGERVSLVDAKADFSQKNWGVKKAIDGNRTSGWAIAPEFFKPHHAVFITQKPIDPAQKYLTIVLDQNYGRGRVLGRFRLSVIRGDPDLQAIPEAVLAVVKKTGKRNRKDQKVIDAYFAQHNPQAIQLTRKMEGLDRQLGLIQAPTTLVMVESEKRKTHMMVRGNYLDPGVEVEAGVPDMLHAWEPGLPTNRLGFAQWLMSPENPLVARVTVNRWWGQLMGRGIVKTEEDFGRMADRPTHPELLDWLALSFMENGWSMKQLLRTIVLSATYQQDSRLGPELLEADPENRWYARGPRHRLSAEMIRDNALHISGQLDETMHGPPIYPPQPGGLWRQTGRNEPKYIVHTDENRYRRGIYVIWRRAAPYASFVNFDGPDRSACHPRRSRTNTPLQALTLMNDETYVELALAFAQRVLKETSGQALEEQLRYAFRCALSRAPRAEELEVLATIYREELDQAGGDQLIAGIKGFKPDPALDHRKLAAWFHLASVLLNLDETINKS
ncbi:MAG: PSD1 and planctomycete cytochrome C domain-containing protein [Verrucomicrobiota bacterium]